MLGYQHSEKVLNTLKSGTALMSNGGINKAAKNSDLDDWQSPRSATNMKKAAKTISRVGSSKKMMMFSGRKNNHKQQPSRHQSQLFSDRVTTKRNSVDYHQHRERDYLQEAKIQREEIKA